MNGFDVVLSRDVPHSVLQRELAYFLNVEADDCTVVDVDDMGSLAQTARVLCTTAAVGGEFPLLLSIYAPAGFALHSREALAEQLSKSLDLSVLVDDGTPHPFRMTLIRWNAAPCPVEIKPADDDRIDLIDSPLRSTS